MVYASVLPTHAPADPQHQYEYTVTVTYHKANNRSDTIVSSDAFFVLGNKRFDYSHQFSFTDDTTHPDNDLDERIAQIDIKIEETEWKCKVEKTNINVIFCKSEYGARYARISVFYDATGNGDWVAPFTFNGNPTVPWNKKVLFKMTYFEPDWTPNPDEDITWGGAGLPFTGDVVSDRDVDDEGEVSVTWQRFADGDLGTPESRQISALGRVTDPLGSSHDEEKFIIYRPAP